MNIIYEMKTTLEGINGVNETENRISNIVDRVAENTQSEQQQQK